MRSRDDLGLGFASTRKRRCSRLPKQSREYNRESVEGAGIIYALDAAADANHWKKVGPRDRMYRLFGVERDVIRRDVKRDREREREESAAKPRIRRLSVSLFNDYRVQLPAYISAFSLNLHRVHTHIHTHAHTHGLFFALAIICVLALVRYRLDSALNTRFIAP
ncbi:hypothetical protein ACS0PU_005182 [Formica fusca]